MRWFTGILFILGVLVLPDVSAQTQQILFTIERSLNRDQIVYILHLDVNRNPAKENPISLKWLDNEKTGELVQEYFKKEFG